MRISYRKIRHARYLYIKRNVEKVWGARYTVGARYLSKNKVIDDTQRDGPFKKKKPKFTTQQTTSLSVITGQLEVLNM